MIKKSIKKKIFPQLFKITPIGGLRKLASVDLSIFYYHMVSDENVHHVRNLYPYKNVLAFKRDINFLLNNFEPIDLSDLLQAINNDRPFKKRSFLLTFDDGFSEMYDVVRPILLEKGVPATFFINSDFIDNKGMCYQNKASVILEKLKSQAFYDEKIKKNVDQILFNNNLRSGCAGVSAINYQQKHVVDDISALLGIDFNYYLTNKQPYLTADQIVHLIKDGFTIGAHSIDHPLFENLSLDEQLYQAIESTKFIKSKFSLNYGVFAFPHKDTGVSSRFFSKIYKNGLIDISFGTAGLARDVIKRNLQRISLENPLMPAQYNVSYSFLRKIYKDSIGKNQISRH